jgi:hypothetical protein
MATPESLVFNRREGTGAAQIFGTPGNPARALMLRQQDAAQRARQRAAEEKLAKEKRDQKMFEIMAVSPEKTFQPFDEQVRKEADTHRAKVVDYFNKGGNPDNAGFQNWNNSQWDRINSVARKGTYIEKKIKDTMDLITKDPYLRQDYYMPKIFDQYMDANGNGKPLDQINVNAIESIYQTDPDGFDAQKYTNDFLSNIKDNVYNWVKKRNTAYGTETDDVELKTKGLLYTPDDSTASGVREDEFGNPELNITNEVINSFADSPNAKRYVETMASRTGQDPRQIMSELIQGNLLTRGGGFAKNVRPQSKMMPWNYFQQQNSVAGFKQEDVPRASQRLRNIGDIMNAFWNEDGTRREDPAPEAMQALNYIAKNTKFGDGEVLEATFVPGNTKPGKETVMGSPVDASPNDRIAFKVKFSDRGSPKVQTIDLDDQTAPALNAIFETAKTEGGYKVGFDQLLNLNQTLGNSLFQPRIDRSYFNKQRAETERAQVGKWQKMEDLDALKGKVLGGKKIAAVGQKTGAWWWSKPTITMTFEDGSQAEMDPNEEGGYDVLSKLYNQGGKTSAPGTGESGIKWE